MLLNKYMLASICNNIENIEDYSVVGNLCYYKDELIGEMEEKILPNKIDIYFKPYIKVEYINIGFTITKSELTFENL